MKKGILFSLAIGATAIISATLISKSESTYYQPRVEVIQSDDAYGAMEYLHSLRADPITGEIDPQAVIDARTQTEALQAKKNKSGALGLNWSNLGPNNIGGRTRAILIDKDNSSIVYAGCVSGGLFKTTTGGTSWAPVNDFFNNLAVTSLGQAANGDIYFGTGEGLYYGNSGTGGRGILGAGMWKSTDGGATFSVLPSTVPSAGSTGDKFASIGKIGTDPTNSNRIYMAATGGFYVSDDAGATWTRGTSSNLALRATDMTVASNGNVWVKEGSVIYKSINGDAGTYLPMTGTQSQIASNGSRMRIAVSPQDPNYVYIAVTSGNTFSEMWQTKNGGDNWTLIGQASSQLDPLQGQASFSLALAVSPIDKERIFIGGVDFWQWSAAGGWARVSSRDDSPTNPFYVHADNHEIRFDPKNGSTIYVGNDGGVFKSTNNGFTWTWLVKEYVTTQFYKIGVGVNGDVLGGTQDNGTIYVNPKSVQPRRGNRTAFIGFRGRFVDGDGGFAELSRLNPSVSFKAMQEGIIGRSIDNQESFSFVLDNNVDPNLIAGEGSFASFITPYRLWEKLDDKNSWDSIGFRADTVKSSLGFGNGGTDYSGTMPRPQLATKFVANGFELTAGFLNVTALPDGTLTGDGTGTFDEATGTYTVSFVSPVNLEIRAKSPVRYESGDTVWVKSGTNELPIVHKLTKNLAPSEVEMIQDPVQSMFFVGATGLATNPGAFDANEDGGIWMTRGALTNINLTPEYFHIAKVGVGVTPTNMTVSPDGDALWVGTGNGRLNRYSNLTNARDSATTSVDDYYVSGVINTPNSSVVVSKSINLPGVGSRPIIDIAINPNDLDKVVVTVGSYGSTTHVYYSNNGTSANPTFVSAQGDLPGMPVYTATFNSRSSNTSEVIIGTDLGVFTTDDISAGAGTSWTQENTGLANVPVFDLVQDRVVRFDLKSDGNSFDGSIYAGTHGRGIFKTTSTSNVISEEEQSPIQIKEIKSLNIFPNPASDFVKVGLNLENSSNVSISIRDISGRLVKTQTYKKLDKDVEEVELNLNGLKSGNYIITIQVGKDVKSGKLLIKK